VNSATSSGASAVPSPSSAFKVSTAPSSRPGDKPSTKAFSAITVAPKPRPSAPVETHSKTYAAPEPISSGLAESSAIETRSPPSPSNNTPRNPNRRASHGPEEEARIAIATRGMKPVGLTKVALAAGNVTSAKACATPQR
jgi:hypothetical protein